MQQFFDALLFPLRALLTSPGKISSSARRLAGISLAARISILVAIFFIFFALAALFVAQTDPQATDYGLWRHWPSILFLLVIIPIVLYFVLRLWLEGEVSRFPDIDYAWKAGMAELRVHGLDLEYVPLFLVLGSPGELQEKVLFTATQLPLRVREIPTGAAALHWYAEPNAVYLVCTDVGCLSKLSTMAKRALEDMKAQPARAHAASASPGEVRGTMVLDQGGEQPPITQTSAELPPPTPVRQSIRGTMMISQDQEDPVVQAVERKPLVLPQETQREQELRLEYLCRLITKARLPLAPINGVLTLLPYNIVQTGRREGSELQRIVKRDLNAVVRTLKLRCPVVSLVIGMEEESGFRELVRRVGRDPAAAQRFGKGFSVGNPPIPEQLEAVAAHACGLFEAKIYELFREKGSISQPGNTKLYALLCKVRRTVRNPLANILVNGYASDPDQRNAADIPPLFFSGCYFAASGEGDGRQAFIKSVVEKLPAEQEELEWTDAALADEDRYQRWSRVALWVDALLLIGLVGMVLYKFFG